MSSTGVQLNDGRVESRVENYTKFWKADPTKEEEADNSKRLDSYTEVVNGELTNLALSVVGSLLILRQ